MPEPEYIVAGQWKDPTEQNRSHPYDCFEAWCEYVNGEQRIYPNERTARAALSAKE